MKPRAQSPDPSSVELTVEAPEENVMVDFLAAARANGLRDDVCPACTRPFLTRESSPLCPPCRMGEPDGWCPAFTVRQIDTGSCRLVEGRPTCAVCRGKGVVGWQPNDPPGPRCWACNGHGQVEARVEP